MGNLDDGSEVRSALKKALNDGDGLVKIQSAIELLSLPSQSIELQQMAKVLAPAAKAGKEEAQQQLIEVARNCADLAQCCAIALPTLLFSASHCNRLVRDSAIMLLAAAAEQGQDISSRFSLLWSLLRDKTNVACLAARALKAAHRAGLDVFASAHSPRCDKVEEIKPDAQIFGLPANCTNRPKFASAKVVFTGPAKRCLVCKSKETRCTYHQEERSEHICFDCGRYSSFEVLAPS